MKEFKILSERSIHHWGPMDTSNKNLLDLGCGRHDTTDLNDSSPIYLGENALKVIAIDGRESEIDYYNYTNIDSDKYQFICQFIDSPESIKKLIIEHNITAIKCDIEEYETNFYTLDSIDMSKILELSIEYHTLEIRDRIINKMNEWGFLIHTEGKFDFVNAPQMGVLYSTRQ
jgi:hypothetical protein